VASLAAYGQAFDGANDFIDAGSAPSLHATAALTLEAWVKIDSLQFNGDFISKAFSSGLPPFYEYALTQKRGASKTIRFTVTAGGVNLDLYGSQTLNPGSWYYLAGTYDGAMMRLYVNGVETDSLAQSGALADFGRPTLLGGYEHSPTVSFQGFLDELRISAVGRGSDFINLSYQAQRPLSRLIRIEPE
jgi:hypothetical protein